MSRNTLQYSPKTAGFCGTSPFVAILHKGEFCAIVYATEHRVSHELQPFWVVCVFVTHQVR